MSPKTAMKVILKEEFPKCLEQSQDRRGNYTDSPSDYFVGKCSFGFAVSGVFNKYHFYYEKSIPSYVWFFRIKRKTEEQSIPPTLLLCILHSLCLGWNRSIGSFSEFREPSSSLLIFELFTAL